MATFAHAPQTLRSGGSRTDDLDISIVIPYKQRLDNIKIALEALLEQTMSPQRFEIIVGAMEYSVEYIDACRAFTKQLNIISVLADEVWNTSRARNIALAQASGRVIVFLDADMLVPTRFLDDLYDRYFASGRDVCVVGQLIGYDEVSNRAVDSATVLPYSAYRSILAELSVAVDVPVLDKRWSPRYAEAVLRCPWALVRTALVAAPRVMIERHGLLFDEGFRGWGPEDQEWGLRVYRTGAPILMRPDVYAIHLPHVRDLTANTRTAEANHRYFLRKWPRRDLELALAYGWAEAARVLPLVETEVAAAVGDDRYTLGVVRGRAKGRDTLVVGALLDAQSTAPSAEVATIFDGRPVAEVFPLVGFSLPYEDQSVEQCRFLPRLMRLTAGHRDVIDREVRRVSKVVAQHENGSDRPEAHDA